MSAKNIPPTLDKIDKIASIPVALPSPLKKKKQQHQKNKTKKGSWQGINEMYVTIDIVEICVATSYIGYCRNLSFPIGSMHDIDSSTIYVAQLLIPFKSACVQTSAISFVAKKEAESYYS